MNERGRERSRRSLISAPLAFAPCAKAGDYFGIPNPPGEQHLTYLIRGEPETLDPARTAGFCEFIIPALFVASKSVCEGT